MLGLKNKRYSRNLFSLKSSLFERNCQVQNTSPLQKKYPEHSSVCFQRLFVKSKSNLNHVQSIKVCFPSSKLSEFSTPSPSGQHSVPSTRLRRTPLVDVLNFSNPSPSGQHFVPSSKLSEFSTPSPSGQHFVPSAGLSYSPCHTPSTETVQFRSPPNGVLGGLFKKCSRLSFSGTRGSPLATAALYNDFYNDNESEGRTQKGAPLLSFQDQPAPVSGSATGEIASDKDQDCRTIVITSGKGGVGKTTTTANLGMSIARLGYRVALIDADIGLRNLDLLLGLENRVLYTAMDIFEGECRLDQALIRDKRLKNLCLLAISKNRQRYNVTRQNMDSLVSSIAALGYNFIFIDCPAGIDVGFINAISPAQEALIVTTPEITAMRDADRVAGLLEANGVYNAKLLINRVRSDMIQRHDMMSVQDVQDVLGIPLLGAIPEDLHVIISTNRGEPLVLRKKLTLSGIALENAARRLIGKQDYLIDLKTPYKGIFQKIQTLLFNN
uniref:Putative septum site-determining protein MinD n=1 Tax=Watanabea reniformis TaxID=191674 RepID=A0A097KK53_9CHLO|nr:septum site-determining protein [Watanabea reniformis]AIT93565.1 septum site-determining protein [Watanabea reniformis]